MKRPNPSTGLLLACFCLTISAQAAPAFKHVIIVFQENRTPDNLFGSNPNFEPGVDIASAGRNSLGATIALQPVSIAGCYDISHANQAFVQMYRGGGMDGADLETVSFAGSCAVPPNPQFAYADNSNGDLQPYFSIATQYGFANRMFQTNQGPSFPAHQFIFGGTSAPTETSRLFASENMGSGNGLAGCAANPGQRVLVIDPQASESQFPPVAPCFDRPTMAAILDGAGISWKYYMNTTIDNTIWNAPAAIKSLCAEKSQNGVRACTNPEYLSNVVPAPAQVLTDIAACGLAQMSWVIPDAKNSDHAGVTGTTGPAWVAAIVNAIGTQPTCPGGDNYWNDTAIIITWDDWGGWYDHVPPFMVGGQKAHHWGQGYTYGFRVPLLVVSAYTQAGLVDNDVHDFGSILRFVEENFGLPRIGPGYYADAFAGGLSKYFRLPTPRSFAVIPARQDGGYFLHQKPSPVGPDND
jgi:phospholipase C